MNTYTPDSAAPDTVVLVHTRTGGRRPLLGAAESVGAGPEGRRTGGHPLADRPVPPPGESGASPSSAS
jgi:hypothetical protein